MLIVGVRVPELVTGVRQGGGDVGLAGQGRTSQQPPHPWPQQQLQQPHRQGKQFYSRAGVVGQQKYTIKTLTVEEEETPDLDSAALKCLPRKPEVLHDSERSASIAWVRC